MSTPNARELEELLMTAVLSKDKKEVEKLLLTPDSRRALEQVMKDLFRRLLSGEDVEKEIVFLSFCEKFDLLILLGLGGALVSRVMNCTVCFDHHKLAALLGKLFDEGMINQKRLKAATALVGNLCHTEHYYALIENLGSRLEE